MLPAFHVSVRHDFLRMQAKLSGISQKQLPFAASQAANRLAKLGLLGLQDHMRRVFDRPTPFTLRGFYARFGTKRDPHGEILARDFAGKGGTPAGKYLLPEELGGQRHLKRFEQALGFKSGEAEFTVPGRGMSLDQYGNITRGQINKILSALGAAETSSGYNANSKTAGRTKRGDTFFLAHSKRDGSLLGVYRVVRTGHVEPVMIFTKKPPVYKPRFKFGATIMQVVKYNSGKVFDEELAKAIATAR